MTSALQAGGIISGLERVAGDPSLSPVVVGYVLRSEQDRYMAENAAITEERRLAQEEFHAAMFIVAAVDLRFIEQCGVEEDAKLQKTLIRAQLAHFKRMVAIKDMWECGCPVETQIRPGFVYPIIQPVVQGHVG